LDTFLELLILLVLARGAGEAAERLGKNASVGELLAGVALAAATALAAPAVPFLDRLVHAPILEELANAGIFFLVLLAGIEMEPSEIAERSAGAFVVALGGTVVPFAGGAAVAWWLLPDSALKAVQALLVGVALSITAIPETMKILSEFGLLRTRAGETVISAAIFDDVLGLFLLALLTGLMLTGSVPDLSSFLWLLLQVAAFFGVTILLGVHVYPRVHRGVQLMRVAAIEFSALVGVALAYGYLAELLGLHWILGAFMAGLFFESARVGDDAYEAMRLLITAISRGFLAPLFFLSIGLRVDLTAVVAAPLLVVLLSGLGFFGKVIGAGGAARLIGLGSGEATLVGTAMTARGAVELVILSIALEAGVLSTPAGDPVVGNLFSALVIMSVVNTLIMPLALGRLRRRTPCGTASGHGPRSR